MDEFCGSQFWDADLSWNTESSKVAPDLTPCFQNTVLVWIPCLVFWTFYIFNCAFDFSSNSSLDTNPKSNVIPLGKFTKSSNAGCKQHTRDKQTAAGSFKTTDKGVIPWSAFNVTKIVICFLLIVTQIVRLGSTIYLKLSNFLVYPVDTYMPILRISTYALALGSIVISKNKGVRSSVIQFIFWFLTVFCQLFKFRTTLLTVFGNNRKPLEKETFTLPIILEVIDYPLIVGQFLLHCWVDSQPIKKTCDKSGQNLECPQSSSSPLSRLLFSWFDSLAWKGSRKALEADDLWGLDFENKSSTATHIFQQSWRSKLYKKSRHDAEAQVGVLSVLFSAFGSMFILGWVLRLIPDLLAFASPQVLNLLIAFMSSDEDEWKGYFYAVLLLLAALVSSLALSHHLHIMYIVGLRVKAALVSALYRKSLVLSNSARKDFTAGQIVNLMSVDITVITAITPFVSFLWGSPLQIGLALYFLWDILGPSVLAGVVVLALLVPMNLLVVSYIRSHSIQQMQHKDERVKLIGEILSGIKILKLYAWEPSFQDEVKKIRQKELDILKKIAYFTGLLDFGWTCTQFVVAVATFTTYVLIDEKNVLDAQKIFVSLSLMNIMTFPLTALPRIIMNTVQGFVSFGRLTKFLNASEIDETAISHDENEVNPILVENGYFSWDGGETTEGDATEETKLTDAREKNVLKNINMEVKDGSLVAIVGPVGSGKSSLLSAILGDVEKMSGRVNTKGSISYVAQQAWIQNGSLRENILFGKQYEARRYNKVINACALGPDLDIFPSRDQIEIGEKGINLSGGQKQRVSIARAVYNDSDLYLLDDPLSAVDSHVGKHIFEKVLGSKGLLGRKTRVLVTNALHFLHQVDSIIVMKNGEISETGTYEQLVAQKGEFAELIRQYWSELEDEIELDIISETVKGQRTQYTNSEFERSSNFGNSSEAASVASKSRKSSQEEKMPKVQEKLIAPENMETAGVKWSIYLDYFRAAGWGLAFLSAMLFVVSQAFAIGSSSWLRVWADEPVVNGTQENRGLYLGVYAGLGIAQSFTFVTGTVVICFAALRSSTTFHANMLTRILRSPMSFFDTTPTGRVVNRFSKDIDVMDTVLTFNLKLWLRSATMVVGTLCIIIYSTPIFVFVIIPISIFYYFVQKFYIPTSRQLKRLESTTRSPILSHFSETLNGASTIRAYGEQRRFIEESEVKLDTNQECYHPTLVSSLWLAVRLETAGSLIIFFAAVFTVLSRDSLSPGLVGLTISYALQITLALNNVVRAVCELEANIVAVERVQEYDDLPQEAPWKSVLRRPAMEWPANGSIQFKNYQTRYRDGMDLVLKSITCDIEPGEKIGVVGRTGAGKSSLTLALFRIIEGVNDGSITVDREDIRKLGLHDVRSRLTIIPQDPVLFSGSLRFNLDPVVKYSDNAVWRALELSNLKTFVEGLQGQLQFNVSEGGGNLSVGQKQLICLARALLRKSKILVLDEATAAVDLETDDLIQKTIRSEFKYSTVITIAHRLNRIMDSDRVMVIENGVISEFDSPANLLENTNSQFYAMANDAGIIANLNTE